MAMDLSVLALSVVKRGEGDLPGLTDDVQAKRLGPKRATRIRRFFKLSKEDDVSLALSSGTDLIEGHQVWSKDFCEKVDWQFSY